MTEQNEIWYEGVGYYAPCREGQFDTCTRWYLVNNEEDAKHANLGTPTYFEDVPEEFAVLPF